jgi:superoxide dismutase, Cu-Zn family
MTRKSIFVALAAAGLGGCAMSEDAGGRAAMAQPGATATLVSASGTPMGTATLSPVAGGVRILLAGEGLPPGPHGVHVHTTGQCNPPDFASAGPHWNPADRQHGTNNPAGPHSGDLPNVTVGADGRGTLDFVMPGVTLTGGSAPLLDPDGAALVVHATADDYRTDPSGNSGGRIACGVITAAR